MSVMSGRFLDLSSSWVSFRAKNPSEVRILVSDNDVVGVIDEGFSEFDAVEEVVDVGVGLGEVVPQVWMVGAWRQPAVRAMKMDHSSSLKRRSLDSGRWV